jgi:hypothetical protein
MQKFTVFDGARMFVTVFTTARHFSIFLNQFTPVHALLSYFLNIHFNIIPHLRLRLPAVLFPSVFATKLCMHNDTFSAHLILPDNHSNSIW